MISIGALYFLSEHALFYQVYHQVMCGKFPRFPEDVLAVLIHRMNAEEEFFRYLLTIQPFRNAPDDLELPLGENITSFQEL